MSSTKRDPARLWKAIKESEINDDIDEVLAMSDAELDAYIASNGGDPAAIRARGAALGKELAERNERLRWHGDMEAKGDAARAHVDAARAARTGEAKRSRTELLARLAAARQDPRFSAPVAALFRDKTPEASTDEELEALLVQIELLAKLEEE